MIADALSRVFGWGQVRPDDPQRYMRYLPVPQLPVNLQFNMDTALQLSVVWACVDAIAKAIASSYWDIYEQRKAMRIYLPDDPLDWILNVSPNPEMTAIGFREALLYSALTWGNGYAEIVRDGAGRVAQLWPLLPERCIPRRHPDEEGGGIYYDYFTLAGQRVQLEQKDVFHVRGPSITGLMGENIVARAAKSIALAIAAERFALSYYGNDTIVGTTIEYPGKLTPQMHEQLRQEWVEIRQGPDKAHKPMILEGGMKLNRANEGDATKTAMTESRKFQIEEICRWYGVPPHKVQHLERATFNNIEHLGLEFVRDALTPWARRLEQEADAKLFTYRPRLVRRSRISLGWLSQGDNKSRAEAAVLWRQSAVKTANEIRHEEGMNPLDAEHGDTLLVGSGMQTMDNLLHPPKPEPAKLPPGKGAKGEEADGDGEGESDPMEMDHEMRSRRAVHDAVVAMLVSTLERYSRRLANRQADLERSRASREKVEANLARERENLRPWALSECGNVASLVRRVVGAELPETTVLLALDDVDTGQPPRAVAERVVAGLLTEGHA